MGFSEKSQMDGCVDSEGKKWVIAGIPLRTPFKPILITKPVVLDKERDDKDDEECSTTPTAVEARIPARLPCPPAPKKKRKPSSRCHYSGVREFFTPPDLETVFIRHVERA